MTSTTARTSSPSPANTAERTQKVRALIRHPRLAACLVYLLVLGLWAPLGLPLPHDPTEAASAATVLSPSAEHFFGTDQFGYDIFSRAILAASYDLGIAALGTAVAAVLGTLLGVLWSRGGVISEAAMRVVDLLQSLPLLAIAITLVGLTGGGIGMLLFIIVMVVTPVFIRLVRAESMLLRKRGYVVVATSYGAGEGRILWRHLVPNSSTVIFPQLSLSLGQAIMMISSLGFLGLTEAGAASWGTMLQSGMSLLLTGQWWITLFPSLMIFTAVLASSEASVALQKIVERPAVQGA